MRDEIRLNGDWQWVLLSPGDQPDAKTPWQPIVLPQCSDGDAGQPRSRAWFKRQITIPQAWADLKIILDLRGARYDPRVLIDGKMIAEFTGGWWPIEVDLTRAVVPGTEHEIQITCDDWQSQLADGFVLPSGAKLEQARGKVLAPIGGYRVNTGVWNDLYLRALSKRRIVDSSLAISPSTHNATLSVRGKIESADVACEIHGTIEAEFETAADADYVIEVHGSSTAMKGEYARMRAIRDGHRSADLEVNTTTPGDFTLDTQHVEKGVHKLAIEYLNDACTDGEDRTLFLQSVRVLRN